LGRTEPWEVVAGRVRFGVRPTGKWRDWAVRMQGLVALPIEARKKKSHYMCIIAQTERYRPETMVKGLLWSCLPDEFVCWQTRPRSLSPCLIYHSTFKFSPFCRVIHFWVGSESTEIGRWILMFLWLYCLRANHRALFFFPPLPWT
jgi:hypothetical protein